MNTSLKCRTIPGGAVLAGFESAARQRIAVRCFLSSALFACCTPPALAQTAVHLQAVAPSDPCTEIASQDLGSCGLGAFGDKNYASARRAWNSAARFGDWQSAVWLGQMYQEGRGVPKDAEQAYAWFDVAAALHGRAIDREHAAADPAARDSNQSEIELRNAAAKNMNAAQIAKAQQMSRAWQKAHAPSKG